MFGWIATAEEDDGDNDEQERIKPKLYSLYTKDVLDELTSLFIPSWGAVQTFDYVSTCKNIN